MPKIILLKRWLLGKDYFALTLGEFILAKGPMDKYQLNHELIHVRQQRELLYLPFFLWYLVEWLVLYVKYRDWTKAYFNIRFEREAYLHQHDLTYLQRRRHYHYGG